MLYGVQVGVLKEAHADSAITFDPPLSKRKCAALRKLGMGSENKVRTHRALLGV